MTAEALPDPRVDAAAFWEALSDEEVFYLLQGAPKVAIWRKTNLGNVTLDAARGQTQAVGGINPEAATASALKSRGYRVPNNEGSPLAWRK